MNDSQREKGPTLVVRKHRKLCTSLVLTLQNPSGFTNTRAKPFPSSSAPERIQTPKRNLFFVRHLTLLGEIRPIITNARSSTSRRAPHYRPHLNLKGNTLDSPICQNKTKYHKIGSSKKSGGNYCKQGPCAKNYRFQSYLSVTPGLNNRQAIPSGILGDREYRSVGFTGYGAALPANRKLDAHNHACVVRSCLTSGGKVQC